MGYCGYQSGEIMSILFVVCRFQKWMELNFILMIWWTSSTRTINEKKMTWVSFRELFAWFTTVCCPVNTSELKTYFLFTLEYRYYLNIDRCAAGGLKHGVRGPEFYVIDKKCSEAYYQFNDNYTKYKTGKNFLCSFDESCSTCDIGENT